jgi:hypothetical protein
MTLNLHGIDFIRVIYAASNLEFRAAYETVIEINSATHLAFTYESNRNLSFKELVTESLDEITSHATFFLVDDIVFTRQIDIRKVASLTSETCIPSLRLGLNISHSYMTQSKLRSPSMRVHSMEQSGLRRDSPHEPCEIFSWNWGRGEGDWGYPLSLDGNLFITQYLRNLIQSLTFSSPNTLEQSMQVDIKSFRRRIGICRKLSSIVNLPINRVQQDFNNSFGTVHQHELLLKWQAGYSIDVEQICTVVNTSVHQDIPITLRLDRS